MKSLPAFGLVHVLSLRGPQAEEDILSEFGSGASMVIAELLDEDEIAMKNGIIRLKPRKKEGLLADVAAAIKPYKGTKPGAGIALKRLQMVATKTKEELPVLIEKLSAGIEKMEAWRTQASACKAIGHDIFIPSRKNLTTFINNQCWDDVYAELPVIPKHSLEYKAYLSKCEANGWTERLSQDQFTQWVDCTGQFAGAEQRASLQRRKDIFAEAHASRGVLANLIKLVRQ